MNPPTTLTNHNPPATIGCGLNPNPIRREESDTPHPQPDDTMPQAALSLFCGEPAFTNGSDSTDPISHEEVAEVTAPSRAPP